jgi:alcohol dehydrogenase class IV
VTPNDGIPGFEFATAGRLVFGRGSRDQAAAAVAALGSRALIVTGRSDKRAQSLLSELEDLGVAHERFAVPSEPTLEQVRQGRQLAVDRQVAVVVGFGGGSALDAAKAIGLLATHDGDPLDYVEVIGRGQSFLRPGLPVVALPTTAGTGTEVTRNAVLASPEQRVKVSLRSPWLLPRLAIVDPELTFDSPHDLTARCGFDALAQLVEPYLSLRANPLTDALCREGLTRLARSLRRAAQGGDDPAARVDLALAATLSGMCLANAGLGIVHGLASVIGGLLSAPHGAVCARLLSPALRVNLGALRQRAADGAGLSRMADLGGWLAGDPRPEAVIEWTRVLADDLGIPRLADFGLNRTTIPQVAQRAPSASSTRANPIELTQDEIVEILETAL